MYLFIHEMFYKKKDIFSIYIDYFLEDVYMDIILYPILFILAVYLFNNNFVSMLLMKAILLKHKVITAHEGKRKK